MRRWSLTFFWVIATMLCVSHVFAQPIFEQSPYIYRLKAAQCTFQPQERALTGFRIQGVAGIVTALHGVADCDVITAISGTKEAFNGLKIRRVDIEHDMATVWTETPDQRTNVGFRTADIEHMPDTHWRELHVIGYPQGMLEQHPTTKIVVNDTATKLADLVPENDETEFFYSRNSPSVNISVLRVEGHFLPGHSGAPLLTPDERVIGVANGGLGEGMFEISWAIPWHDINWVSFEQMQTKVAALRHHDPSLSFSFSNTWLKQQSTEILLRPVTERSVNAFRSREQTTITPASGGQPIELRQEMSYNGLRNERSVEGTSNSLNRLLGKSAEVINKLGAYWIGADNYYLQEPVLYEDGRLGAFCRKIGQPITDFDDLFQFRSQLMSSPVNASTALNGVYLSDETINGVPTRHYLVTIPPISRLGFSATIQSIVGDIWVAKQGNYIVRFVGEAPVWSASNPALVTGTLHQVIDFYDVGKDIDIVLPAACTDPAPSAQPTATRPAALTQTAPTGTIHRVWPEYDVVQDGQQGMRIHVDFTVNGGMGIESYVTAYFFYASGEMLQGNQANYRASNGQLVTYNTFTPDNDFARYADFALFLPYDELPMRPGEYDLKFVVNIIIPFGDAAIADESDFTQFRFSRQ